MSEQNEEVDPALQALLDEAIAAENDQINTVIRTHLQQRVVATSVQLRQAEATIQNLETMIEDLSRENEELRKKIPKQPTDRKPRKTAATKKSTVTPIKK